MNRKGHTPTIFILIIALILVGYTLFSYATSFRSVSSVSNDIISPLDDVGSYQQFVHEAFSQSIDSALSGIEVSSPAFVQKFKDEVDRRDYRIEGNNFFSLVRNNAFSFEQDGDHYVLEVEGIFISTSSSQLKITRTFSATANIYPDKTVQYIYK